jgi:hypothetical protein
MCSRTLETLTFEYISKALNSEILTELILVSHKEKVFKDSTYFLTYSMEQSPSSEANWFAASQDIPDIHILTYSMEQSPS